MLTNKIKEKMKYIAITFFMVLSTLTGVTFTLLASVADEAKENQVLLDCFCDTESCQPDPQPQPPIRGLF